jgi:hypothetical protein
MNKMYELTAAIATDIAPKEPVNSNIHMSRL